MKKVLGSAAFIFPVSMVLAVAAAAIFPVPAAAQNYQYLIPRGGENAKPYEPGVQLNPNGGSGPTALEQARRYQEQQRQEQERKEREAYNLKRQLGEAVYQSQKAFVTQRYDAKDYSKLNVSRTYGLDGRFHRENRIVNGTSVMDCAQRCDAEGSGCNSFEFRYSDGQCTLSTWDSRTGALQYDNDVSHFEKRGIERNYATLRASILNEYDLVNDQLPAHIKLRAQIGSVTINQCNQACSSDANCFGFNYMPNPSIAACLIYGQELLNASRQASPGPAGQLDLFIRKATNTAINAARFEVNTRYIPDHAQAVSICNDAAARQNAAWIGRWWNEAGSGRAQGRCTMTRQASRTPPGPVTPCIAALMGPNQYKEGKVEFYPYEFAQNLCQRSELASDPAVCLHYVMSGWVAWDKQGVAQKPNQYTKWDIYNALNLCRGAKQGMGQTLVQCMEGRVAVGKGWVEATNMCRPSMAN
ncbi:MAG: PAN/Apple domain-containing protein [Tepidamorphaceae bacterium]